MKNKIEVETAFGKTARVLEKEIFMHLKEGDELISVLPGQYAGTYFLIIKRAKPECPKCGACAGDLCQCLEENIYEES